MKLIKDKAYSKRYQVKYRRRRQGKTDYYARKRLVAQAKNKYQTPKYRFVVRISNKYVTCQLISAKIDHDEVLCAAHSSELARYGMPVGLKSYPAAYATGLLLARRLLTKLSEGKEQKLSEMYEGETEVSGEVTEQEAMETPGKKFYIAGDIDEELCPFRCILDVGLAPTTLGARVFGALKGAVDGGLDIPHNHKKFPGYDPEEKEYNAEFHAQKINGAVIGDYMDKLKADTGAEKEFKENFETYFASYIKHGITDGETLQEKWAAVREAIRADPTATPYTKPDTTKFAKKTKRSNAQRKDRVRQKIEAHNRA